MKDNRGVNPLGFGAGSSQREMNMRSNQLWLSRAAAVSSLLLFCGLQAFGAQARGIKPPKAGETVEVLVQYATQPTEEKHRRVTDRNGRIRAAFEHIPVAHYDVTSEALAGLEADPDVVSINPNLPLGAFVNRAISSELLAIAVNGEN